MIRKLADITLVEFTEIAHNAGVTNDGAIAELFNNRPQLGGLSTYTYESLFQTFYVFKDKLNSYENPIT